MKNIKFRSIRIYFKDGKVDEIPKRLWTDYQYVEGLFVVIWKGAWIAVYNMDDVACIAVDVKRK